jgi:hypothetical protein
MDSKKYCVTRDVFGANYACTACRLVRKTTRRRSRTCLTVNRWCILCNATTNVKQCMLLVRQVITYTDRFTFLSRYEANSTRSGRRQKGEVMRTEVLPADDVIRGLMQSCQDDQCKRSDNQCEQFICVNINMQRATEVSRHNSVWCRMMCVKEHITLGEAC